MFDIKGKIPSPLLTVNHLTIYHQKGGNMSTLVDDLTFSMYSKERLSIIGNSGSGKSITLKAILGILPENLILDAHSEILIHPELRFKKKIAYIPQNPQLNLNPLMTIGLQISEAVKVIEPFLTKKDIYAASLSWINKVGLENPRSIYDAYPHELSGGQLQRVIIAMAICQQPALIFADEPTTALDPIRQNQVLHLLFSLADLIGAGVIMISHDQDLISKWTEKWLFLKEGRQVQKMEPAALTLVNKNRTITDNEVILDVCNLSVSYQKGWFKPTYFPALKNLSFTLKRGECLGVIGVSGSGKSSLAKAICGLIPIQNGNISFFLSSKNRQLIFQNPYLSLNPAFTIQKALMLAIKTLNKSKEYNLRRIKEVLNLVQLNESYLAKFPHECSGGEQQRIAIARAICVNPDLLILDESLASLDAERQISILNLLNDIQHRTNISILFISHDIKRVTQFCDKILVLSNGTVVEYGVTKDVMKNPVSLQTRELFQYLS
jgi:ABC-type glutathione transport system ATPase component